MVLPAGGKPNLHKSRVCVGDMCACVRVDYDTVIIIRSLLHGPTWISQ